MTIYSEECTNFENRKQLEKTGNELYQDYCRERDRADFMLKQIKKMADIYIVPDELMGKSRQAFLYNVLEKWTSQIEN
jgi:hypothetical protein